MPPFTPSSHAAGVLTNYPPVERWDDWTEYDPAAWPTEGRPQIHAGSDDLLQLRGSLRAPGLCGQAGSQYPQV